MNIDWMSRQINTTYNLNYVSEESKYEEIRLNIHCQLTSLSIWTLNILLFLRVCECVHTCVCVQVHHSVDVEVRTKFWNWFSSSTAWVPGLELGLGGKHLTHRAILSVHSADMHAGIYQHKNFNL